MGVGDETVQVGESGYNAQGQSGVFDGSNGYEYLYPYRYIWIDLTIIRTSNYQKLKRSDTYESLLWIQSNEERLRFCSRSGQRTAGDGVVGRAPNPIILCFQ